MIEQELIRLSASEDVSEWFCCPEMLAEDFSKRIDEEIPKDYAECEDEVLCNMI